MSERDSRILIGCRSRKYYEAAILCDKDSHHPDEDLVLDHQNDWFSARHCRPDCGAPAANSLC
jgi:hypothetical protein